MRNLPWWRIAQVVFALVLLAEVGNRTQTCYVPGTGSCRSSSWSSISS